MWNNKILKSSLLHRLDVDRRNDLVLIIVHTATVVLVCFIMLIRHLLHGMDIDMLTTYIVMGWMPLTVEYILWKNKSRVSIKTIVLISFSCFYMLTMFNMHSPLLIMFSAPILLATTIYRDYIYVIESNITYVLITLISSIAEFISKTNIGLGIDDLTLMLLVHVLIILSSLFIAYVYELNHNDQLDKIEKARERITYAYNHDAITDLYNRNYLMENKDNLLNNKDLPLAIVLLNINGLKIINDFYGNNTGDEVIEYVGMMIKEQFSGNSTPLRLDGDEFLIILPKTTEDEAKNRIEKLLDDIKNKEIRGLKVSVEYGITIKDAYEITLDNIITQAKNNVYQKKMLNKDGVRSAVIKSLRQSLSQSDFETEAHANRTKNMVIKLGKRLGLSDIEQSQVGLLAILHDIGKMAIPREILLKPGKLNSDEWEIMKTHTNKGYAIATSTDELKPIASGILHHHEKWDGTGYPGGLSGDDIPLIARIITIVDSHDVMTHDRCYHKAMSQEAAIEELRRCSGTQFDPYIVEDFIEMISDDFGLKYIKPCKNSN